MVSGKMMIDLDDIVDRLLDDHSAKYKGVILYGAGGNFCAGGDLKMTKQKHNSEIGNAMAMYMGHVLDKFKNLPMITVAYIDGSGNYRKIIMVSSTLPYNIYIYIYIMVSF